MHSTHLNLKQFIHARTIAANFVKKTPVVHSHPLSHVLGQDFYLKCEMLQSTGSFKLRGAANKLLNLPKDKIKKVIAVSTGNHGCAVAYMAQNLGFDAFIYVSNNVPQNKLDNIRQYGAKIIVSGHSQDDAEVEARKAAEANDAALIHPFDDEQIIAGQGTMALDLVEQIPNLENVLVPLSGGGLISGVACALKQLDPNIKIIGISMEKGAAMHASIQAKKPIEVEEVISYADSLQGGIGLNNQYTYEYTKKFVDEYILVKEDEILSGVQYLLQNHRFLVEGASAVSTAAVLSGKLKHLKGRTACILTGNNVDANIIQKFKGVS